MPISGLVVTLDRGGDDDTIARMSSDDRLTLGERIGRVVPVVAETATIEEGTALVHGLMSMSGVLAVDVVSIDFAPLEDPGPESCAGGGEHGSA